MKKGTIAVLSTLLGATVGTVGSTMHGMKEVEKKEKKVDKFKSYYNLLLQWLEIKQEGKNLVSYFEENNYKKIAIYGMGELGNRLYEELKGTEIEVKYAIDKNAENTYSELDVYTIDEQLEEVDAVVVSAIFAFDEIEKELSDKVDCPIISLEDVVYEI